MLSRGQLLPEKQRDLVCRAGHWISLSGGEHCLVFTADCLLTPGFYSQLQEAEGSRGLPSLCPVELQRNLWSEWCLALSLCNACLLSQNMPPDEHCLEPFMFNVSPHPMEEYCHMDAPLG